MKLKIHELATIFPPMTPNEFKALKEDVKRNGLLNPILVNESNQVIDGRNRYLVCQELGIEPKTQTIQASEEELVTQIISLNLKRRHLTASQRAVIALKIEKIYSVGAARRRRETQNNKTAAEFLPDEEILPGLQTKGRARDQAGKECNVSGRYISDAKKIQNHSSELLGKVAKGELSIKQAIQRVEKDQRRKKSAILKRRCKEKFQLLVADPPWERAGGLGEWHYETIPDEQIVQIIKNVDIAPDAILFVWVVNSILPRALQLLKELGFEYKTNIVWHKTKRKEGGMGVYARNMHAVCLVATIGDMRPQSKERMLSCFEAPMREHSQKPDFFFKMLEKAFPATNKIELFAREERKGWSCYGNELDKFNPLELNQ